MRKPGYWDKVLAEKRLAAFDKAAAAEFLTGKFDPLTLRSLARKHITQSKRRQNG